MNSALHFEFPPGTEVIVQGNIASYFFMIRAGSLQVIVDEEISSNLKKGDTFGEMALISDAKRAATVRTISTSQLWGIERQSFEKAMKSLNERHFEENLWFLDSIPELNCLSPDDKEAMVSAFATHHYKQGDKIIEEGTFGDLFYIIKQGSVLCHKGGEELSRLQRGGFFGEQAILHKSKRTATVTAEANNTICLSVNKDVLYTMLDGGLQQYIYRHSVSMSLKQSYTLKSLTEQQRDAIAKAVTVNTYAPGNMIIPEGSPLTIGLYIIVKGSVNLGFNYVGTHTCIGDNYITQPNITGTYQYDAVAAEFWDIAQITLPQFEQAIGGNFIDSMQRSYLNDAMKSIDEFKHLSDDQVQRMVKSWQKVSAGWGDVLLQKGKKATKMYIIITGSVCVQESYGNRIVRAGWDIGTKDIIIGKEISATVVAEEECQLWWLYKATFQSICGKSSLGTVRRRITITEQTINIADLHYVERLGHGTFGKVFLTYHMPTGNYFALKAIPRKKIIDHRLYDSLDNELQVLKQIDHQFMLKLHKTSKDDKYVHFITDYIPGEELFKVLRQIGVLQDEGAKFYTAIFLCILEYLAAKKIVFRDLKPENVIVSENGYLKLVDFGASKIVKSRTYTIMGTPHYMAPEVILGKGYRFSCDLWSLGILLYEFLWGQVPFAENVEDVYKIYEDVLKAKLVYPVWLSSGFPARKLLEQLLSLNPAARGSASTLRKHPYFSGFNFEALHNGNLTAPYIPRQLDTREIKNGTPILQVIDTHFHHSHDLGRSKKTEEVGWDRLF